MSYNPAKLLDMNKGKISVGIDGDFVLIDTDKKVKINPEEFASKGRNTPFDGMEFYGEVLATIKGGVLYNYQLTVNN
jgi:dihydroorotase